MVIDYKDLIKTTTVYTPKEYRNLGGNHFPVYSEIAWQEKRAVNDIKTNIFSAYLISTLESVGLTSFDIYRAKLFVMCENLVAAGRGHLDVYYCDKRQVWDNPKVKFNIPEMALVKQKTGF